MHLDVVDLRSFYSQPLGRTTRRVLTEAIGSFWPTLAGERVAGIGFATPYLRPYLRDAERVLGLMPAAQGVLHWPPEGPFVTTLVDEGELPLPDAAVDRLIAVHSFEVAEALPLNLREIWRVLAPGGRLIAVVPNRVGLWARLDTTPFGIGRPFSKSQLSALLKDANLSPEHWTETLYMPPVKSPLIMRSAGMFEKAGRRLGAPMAGVLVVEATKQVYQRVPHRAARRFSVRIAPVFTPEPATPRNSS